MRHSRNDSEQCQDGGRKPPRFDIAELCEGLIVQRLLTGHARHDDRSRDREQKSGYLGNQSVAHRKRRITLEGLRQAHTVLQATDQRSAKDVDQQDENAGNCVAPNKLTGAVH